LTVEPQADGESVAGHRYLLNVGVYIRTDRSRAGNSLVEEGSAS